MRRIQKSTYIHLLLLPGQKQTKQKATAEKTVIAI